MLGPTQTHSIEAERLVESDLDNIPGLQQWRPGPTELETLDFLALGGGQINDEYLTDLIRGLNRQRQPGHTRLAGPVAEFLGNPYVGPAPSVQGPVIPMPPPLAAPEPTNGSDPLQGAGPSHVDVSSIFSRQSNRLAGLANERMQLADCLELIVARRPELQLSEAQIKILLRALIKVSPNGESAEYINAMIRGRQFSDLLIAIVVRILFDGYIIAPFVTRAVLAMLARGRPLDHDQIRCLIDALHIVRWPEGWHGKIRGCIQALNSGQHPSNSQMAAVVRVLFAREPEVMQVEEQGISER
ncbi:hypothetical protein F53441_1768 [Fusarium austroafricanum]|uniref:Uncharacterized protein n=1 Tax=Fusarium austroafricanum TaxID=2364996 RepID=A0A8H4PCV3_9HYPO|nr:hypothetical protein F53441_1768 [Fusarium austroafricanum]